MHHGFRVGLPLWASLVCALVSPSGAEEPAVVFKGKVGDLTLWAYSVAVDSDAAALADLVDRPDLLLLIYQDYKEASSLEPLAVFAGDRVKIFNDRPARSRDAPTIGDLIRDANIAGPKKLAVVCKDGTRPSLSGRSQLTQLLSSWRSCARRGGVSRSFNTTTRDPRAVIATICEDYSLVAGGEEACESSALLAEVLNRRY